MGDGCRRLVLVSRGDAPDNDLGVTVDYEFNRNRIVRAAIKGVLETLPGGKATLTPTDDWQEEFAGPTRDSAKIIKELCTTDEEAIHFYDSEGNDAGWIHLVHDYGSNPGEIICNYTMKLEKGLERSSEIASHIMDRWDAQDD